MSFCEAQPYCNLKMVTACVLSELSVIVLSSFSRLSLIACGGVNSSADVLVTPSYRTHAPYGAMGVRVDYMRTMHTQCCSFRQAFLRAVLLRVRLGRKVCVPNPTTMVRIRNMHETLDHDSVWVMRARKGESNQRISAALAQY